MRRVIQLGDALRDDARLIRRLVTHRLGEVTAKQLVRQARQVGVQIDGGPRAAWDNAQTCHAAWRRVPTRHRRVAQRGVVLNLFRLGRHLLRAVHHRLLRTHAFGVWREVTCV